MVKYLKYAKFGVALATAIVIAADQAFVSGGSTSAVVIAVVGAVAVFFTKNKV